VLLMFTIRAAGPEDIGAIRALLVSAKLPVNDLPAGSVAFLLAEDDGGMSGVIGIEAFESAALLRSLAVAPQQRRTGVGRALVEALERHALASGISQLALLTETAAPFFQRLGYTESSRDDTPVAIRSSEEFRSLCPASAICMTKVIR
jgi:N-acetylglutamate synthase-like GNAT family acetyltransferase